MICVSLSNIGFEECLSLAREEPFVEFRFDLMDLTPTQAGDVVSASHRSIATYRPDTADTARRIRTMISAMKSGTSYVDIELEADSSYREELTKAARTYGTDVIVSYHNFDSTPEAPKLKTIVDSCKKAGADVVKIACQVNNNGDLQSLMGLYGEAQRMVVIGMGKKGLITRISASFMGAEFTFASPGIGRETAPGQIDREQLASIIASINKYNSDE